MKQINRPHRGHRGGVREGEAPGARRSASSTAPPPASRWARTDALRRSSAEKKLRARGFALNATKAAVEEGASATGGGCTLLKLAAAVDDIKPELPNDDQKLGAWISSSARSKYSMRLIASNAGDNGSVVVERVTSDANPDFGYNAATGKFEDLMVNGIIDPTKVIRCALENSCLRGEDLPHLRRRRVRDSGG